MQTLSAWVPHHELLHKFMIPICLLDNKSDFENSMLEISRHIAPQTLVTGAKSVV